MNTLETLEETQEEIERLQSVIAGRQQKIRDLNDIIRQRDAIIVSLSVWPMIAGLGLALGGNFGYWIVGGSFFGTFFVVHLLFEWRVKPYDL